LNWELGNNIRSDAITMRLFLYGVLVSNLLITVTSLASVETVGPDGINAAGLITANGLPLNGGAVGTVSAVAIGQAEPARSADKSFDTDPTLTNTFVDPAGVFFLKQGPPLTRCHP
jgi:hypothetical protein